MRLDPVRNGPDLAVPADIVDRCRHVILLVLDRVVERDDQIALCVSVNPAVLDFDDVRSGAGPHGREHALRQTIRDRDLDLDVGSGIGRHELLRELARPASPQFGAHQTTSPARAIVVVATVDRTDRAKKPASFSDFIVSSCSPFPAPRSFVGTLL